MTGSLQINKGKYYAIINIKDEEGKRKQKWINLHLAAISGNKRKAEKALRDVISNYEQMQSNANDVLFSELLYEWVDEAKSNLEVITYEAYLSYIDNHINPYFKELGLTVSQVQYQHLQNYYNSKRETLSGSSLKRNHAVINQSLKKAMKMGFIDKNPADIVTLPKVEKFQGKFLSVEEGNALLDFAKGKVIEPVIVLAMMYGLRRSEIAGLKWSAVDFENNKLSICHTVTMVKTVVAKDKTKNQSSRRTLPLNSIVREFLLTLKKKQEQDQRLFGNTYFQTDYVCRWEDGRPLSCNYMSHSFRKLLVHNSLPRVRLHDLRHTCASYLLKAGCSMKEISEWLGHSSIGITMNTYTHIDFETKKITADKIASILAS